MSLSALFRTLRLTSLKNNDPAKTLIRLYSLKVPRQGIVKEADPITGELKTKKVDIIPKITLISGDSVSVTTLKEAENISKRRDLKLVRILDMDTKSQRPIYKLMTGAEYHAEDLKQREQKKLQKVQNLKGEKVLLINSKIAQHDLDIQLKKALKWIQKLYEVRVVISGAVGNAETSEKVSNYIAQFLKDENIGAKITQKRIKGADIKFQIVPSKNEEQNSNL